MYAYIYAEFLQQKKYEKTLAKVEARLTDLGLSGKICRLTPLINLKSMLKDLVERDAETIVVVGDERLLAEVVNLTATKNVVVGFIPVGKTGPITQELGLPSGEEACEIISARRIEKIDLGKIGNQYFLFYAQVPNRSVTLNCDGHYDVSTQGRRDSITVYNFLPALTKKSSPQDGYLQIVVQPRQKTVSWLKKEFHNLSVFPTKKIEVRSAEVIQITTDSATISKTPAAIEISPQKMKFIVGKERLF